MSTITKDITFTAGQTIPIGSFTHFKLVECSSPVDIVFTTQDGTEIGEANDVDSTYTLLTPFATNTEKFDINTRMLAFAKITSAVAQTVKVAYSAGGSVVDYDKIAGEIIVGNNSSISRDYYTDLGQSFMGQSSHGGTAAQYSHVFLYNPAGSGVNIYLDSFRVNSSNNNENWAVLNILASHLSGGSRAASKLDGTLSKSFLGSGSNVNAAFYFPQNYAYGTYRQHAAHAGYHEIVHHDPIKIEPGDAFIVANQVAVNSGIFAEVAFREILI